MATLSSEVLQDDMAVALARVMATANKRARELGIDVVQSLITISQQFDNGLNWRVNYGPRDYLNRRGGDLMIEVSGEDMKIKQVLRGQWVLSTLSPDSNMTFTPADFWIGESRIWFFSLMWEHGKDKDPVEFLDDRGIVK